MPLVSVVIPTYRHAATVVATLESVFAQTFRDVEVIVVNDGSPDDTAAVLAPYVADGRIRYVEQANAGQGAARNRGIAMSRGEFIALLDDDDLWPPDKLGWQVERLRAEPDAVLAYGYAQLFGDRDDRRPAAGAGRNGCVRDALYGENFIVSPGQTLIRAEALRRVGGFDERIWGCDDWDLYLRLSALAPFAYDDRVALRYRVHGGNASNESSRLFRNAMRVLHKHLGWFPTPGKTHLWWRCRRFAGGLVLGREIAAYNAARHAGRRWAAATHAARAVRYWPPLLLERSIIGNLAKWRGGK